MELQYRHSFYIPDTYEKRITELLAKYNVTCEPKGYPFDSNLSYDFIVTGKTPNVEELNTTLAEMILSMSSIKIQSYVPLTYYLFDKQDYEVSPFFRLTSTGNSRKAFLESKRATKITKHELSHCCGVHTRELLSSLVINGSGIGKRLAVNVDTEHWVITEKLASLLNEWGMKGYRLEDVICMNASIPKMFRLIPEVIMPPWADTTEYLYFEDRAQCCDLRNYVPHMYHYQASSIEQVDTDFAVTNELVVSGDLAYRPLLVSARFRKFILENKISKEILNIHNSNYKSYDWLFDPIAVDLD